MLSFVYLDSTLAERSSFDNEISLRIEKASGSFWGLEKRCLVPAWPQNQNKGHGLKSMLCDVPLVCK